MFTKSSCVFSHYNFWKLRRIQHTWASTIIDLQKLLEDEHCTFKTLLNSRNHFIIMWKFMCQNTLRAANICAERLKYGTDIISMWEWTSKQNAFRFWFQNVSTNNRLPQNFCWIKRKEVKFYSLSISVKHRKWPRKSYIDEECTLSPLEVYVTRCS